MSKPGSSSENKHQNEVKVIIDFKDNVERPDHCCIYKVPKKLRNINNDAYSPHIVSIGPYHHDQEKWDDVQSKKEWKRVDMQSKKEWKWDDMQNLKKSYQKEIFENITKKEKLNDFVKKEEQHIRACYEDKFEGSFDFKEMILDDAVFIIELFLRNYHDDRRDFLVSKPWLTNAIKLDLQLLENQLPYFVLEELYMLAYGYGCSTRPSFLTLSCEFFGYKELDREAKKIKHFVDLRRHTMLVGVEIDPNIQMSLGGKIEDLPSAVKLNESGVKFWVENKDSLKPGESRRKCKQDKENENEKGLLNIKFEKRARKDSYIWWLRGRVLKIPHLKIEDGTECLFRNLMALEQCHYPFETRICNYIDLMDALINTRKDVDLLVDKKIISNCVGDHDSIKEMFNRLCLEITPSTSCYQRTCGELKKHHEIWWNRTKATLISVYFENLWRGTGTVAAAVLLLLTLLQTIKRFYPALFTDPQ
ncbi:UPF0481 protein At3g47200-like [Pistacia vera]|uniref:UPF0481 protein At3g47200-like n=1 Tax=Pistacia vera TaxID=55513 RepID=UPI00126373BD|nr:UPF0481 protein At3g47200-like [Pistacia vera]